MTFFVISYSDTESVNVGYFILGFVQPQTPHQIFFLFYCEEMREPVLSVSACVEQDEQDNTTMAPFQIFDSVIHWIRKKNNAD